jgi:predicted nucleotidyltransferase
MTALLDRSRLLEIFELMDRALEARGTRADIFVVGGAALSIAYDARRSTSDVDAIFAPSSVVREVANSLGEELGLEDGWLNDAVKGFIPGEDPDQIAVFEGRYLKVAAASARFLLAMKLLASRTDRDVDDITFLYGLLGFSTADEGLDLVESFYPRDLILPRVALLLHELYPPHISD